MSVRVFSSLRPNRGVCLIPSQARSAGRSAVWAGWIRCTPPRGVNPLWTTGKPKDTKGYYWDLLSMTWPKKARIRWTKTLNENHLFLLLCICCDSTRGMTGWQTDPIRGKTRLNTAWSMLQERSLAERRCSLIEPDLNDKRIPKVDHSDGMIFHYGSVRTYTTESVTSAVSHHHWSY